MYEARSALRYRLTVGTGSSLGVSSTRFLSLQVMVNLMRCWHRKIWTRQKVKSSSRLSGSNLSPPQ